MIVRKQTYVRKYLCQQKSPTIEASFTVPEASDLVWSIRHLLNGGSPAHVNATQAIEFLFEMLISLEEKK